MIKNYDSLKPLIEKNLTLIIDNYKMADAHLKQAIGYAVMAGGKRLRPVLTLMSADLFGVPRAHSLKVAAAIELIHCYSLIHDDLPALDNSPLRRGMASCWKKYGESTAILAGDALIPMAYDLLDLGKSGTETVCLDLIRGLTHAIGPQGMVGGQKMDMNPHPSWTLDDIITMQTLKTGKLIAFSCEAGAILGQQPSPLCSALREYGLRLGLLYQIADDLLDQKSTIHQLGKPTQQDALKKTIVSHLGQENAYAYAQKLCEEAAVYLQELPFAGRTGFLDLLSYALNRVS